MKEIIDKKWNIPAENIHHLIMETVDFIVYIDAELDIDWQTSDDYDEAEPKKRDIHNQVLNYAARLESTPLDHHEVNVRLNFKRMIGEAIARSLDYDEVNGLKMLKGAEEYITERTNEKSRYWYLLASGYAALFFAVVGILGWLNKQYLIGVLGETGFFLSLSSVAGSLGALFSIIQRLGKSNMNSAAGKALHYLEGSYKIIAGCISALIIAAAVNLGIILPIFSKVDNTHLAMFLAGLIAGASERIAPSFISNVETTASKERGKKTEV